MDIGTPQNQKKSQPEKTNFFQSLISSLFGGGGPDAEIKKRLKVIAKNYSKTRYHNFYKPNPSEMQPPFAKLFYDVYKIICPTQVMFKNIQNKKLIQNQIISFCLSERQTELLGRLNEDAIKELAKKIPIDQLRQNIEEDMETFSAEFDAKRAFMVESTYKAYMALYDFCMFDFYFMLKKFSSRIVENSFGTTPTFDKINAEYVLDDLKDFCTILYSIPGDLYWDNLFNMFKERNINTINQNTWKKVLAKMKSIQASNAFEMIIQMIAKDPKYRIRLAEHNETIVDTYLDKMEEEVYNTLHGIEAEQKTARTNNISAQIFGDGDIQTLKNYTDNYNNGVLSKKELDLYEYTDSLNYLATFLNTFVKHDLQTYADIVIVRGQWDTSMAQPMSQAFQELLSYIPQIAELDDSLAEEGPMGMKIKNLLPQMAHDPGAENIINRVVSDANEKALELIQESTKNFIIIGKMMKQLIEDHQRKKAVIVQNWKELEKFSETPLLKFEVDSYKKIFYFVQLMQTCLQNG